MPLTDYQAKKELDQRLSATAWTAPGTLYLGLLTDTNTQAQRNAGTYTEMTGGGYARVAMTNNATVFPAAAGANPPSKASGAAATFPVPTAGQGTAHAIGLWDAATTGNLLYWAPLAAAAKGVSVSAAGLFTAYAHGYTAGTVLQFNSVGGFALPTGLTDGAIYYVIAGSLATDTFTVSATLGGTAVSITTAGGGKVAVDQSITPSIGVAVTFPSGGLTFSEQ